MKGGRRTPAAPPGAFDASSFVREQGVVLASGKGPVPNLADAVAGEPIRGTWWAHPKSHAIFDALGALDADADVLCFRLVQGKLTLVHRRLFPALVRLRGELGEEKLAAIRQEHTASGAHRNVVTPLSAWASGPILDEAGRLTDEQARAALGPWTTRAPPRR